MHEAKYAKPQDTLLDVLFDFIENPSYTNDSRRKWLEEEIAEKFSGLTFVIEKVVDNMIAADRNASLYGDNGGWWWGSYINDRPSDYNLARVKLAEYFGAARDFDIEEQAKANLEGARRMKEELDKEQKKNYDLQRRFDQQERRIGHLAAGLKRMILVAESAIKSGKIDGEGYVLNDLLFGVSDARDQEVNGGVDVTHLCFVEGCRKASVAFGEIAPGELRWICADDLKRWQPKEVA